MILYSYFRSSTSYRIRIALNLLGYQYEMRPINLSAGEQNSDTYLAVNPFGTVPALDWNGAIYEQSLAILELLNEKTVSGALWSEDPIERATARECAYAIATEMHAPNNLARLKGLKRIFGADQDKISAWYSEVVHFTFTPLEQRVGSLMHQGRPFLFGAPGGFECCLVPQIYNARRFNVSLKEFPKLLAIDAACAELESFQRALPENQPDAE